MLCGHTARFLNVTSGHNGPSAEARIVVTSLTVDIRRPKIKSGAADVIESTSFCAHNRSNCLNVRIIECRAHEDGLREGCCVAEVARSREDDSGAGSYTMLVSQTQH